MFLEINSPGLLNSSIPCTTKPQLSIGPQKCVVLGPTGECINLLKIDLNFYIKIYKTNFKIHSKLNNCFFKSLK